MGYLFEIRLSNGSASLPVRIDRLVSTHDVVLTEIVRESDVDDVERTMPGFSRRSRWNAAIEALVLASSCSTSPITTFAVPCTTVQCSDQWWCICIESFARIHMQQLGTWNRKSVLNNSKYS